MPRLIIAPDDAFRLMLSARLSDRYSETIKKIDLSWFRYPTRLPAPVLVLRPIALEVLETLRRHVREQDIKLQGEIDGKAPADIDPADCITGELGVFERTLKIYARPQDIKPLREYTRVFCITANVMKIVNSIATNQSKLKSESTLKPAPDGAIRDQIGSVYSDAEKSGSKAPNLEELLAPVRERLKPLGYKVSRERIRNIASEPQFKSRRGPVGKTLS
jgi:hypothetical protein